MNAKLIKDCLFEIGCEELPTATLQPLAASLAQSLQNQFLAAHLSFTKIEQFVTPRRLAVVIYDLSTEQPEQNVEQLGPSYELAFDSQGHPTPACLGFARTWGATSDQLSVKETPKGKRIAFLQRQAGVSTIDLLPQILHKALAQLPIPKPMRWGSHSASFVRPVHWAILMYGAKSVDAEFFGVKTTRFTYGHRFHYPHQLEIPSPADYSQVLEQQGFVIASFDKRRQLILDLIDPLLQVNEIAVIEPELLNEVTSLVEWPVALRGQFKSEFLKVPQEVLMTSMQIHQKCFPMVDNENTLLPAFIVISNIESKDAKAVIHGNERVIHARLTDAVFFYENDCKRQLADRASQLHHVVFQKELGTLAEKVQRIVNLSEFIASKVKADVLMVGEAAALSKCDLLSEMVGEFPDLQGVMGYYYALNDGLSLEIALAIKQHYWPRFAGDVLPENLEGTVLALADRIDTLVGILGINQIPTGDKDPFGVRRIALAICRLVIEKSLPIDLVELLKRAAENYRPTLQMPNKEVVEHAFGFIMQRVKSWYLDQNVSIDIFNAVAACKPTKLIDFNQRVMAILEFKRLPEAEALASANKRVSNILKKQTEIVPETIDTGLLVDQSEQKLVHLLEDNKEKILKFCEQGNYFAALSQLATFKEVVDEFFNNVMVMVEDKAIRLNRLAMLVRLRQLFIQIADIALLQ